MKHWYYSPDNKQRLGPVTADELQQLALSGVIRSEHMVMREGDGKWLQAAKVKGLFPEPQKSISPKLTTPDWLRGLQPYLLGFSAFIVGVLALPTAIAFSFKALGIILAGFGILLALFAFVVQRGPGLRLSALSLLASGPSLLGAVLMVGGPGRTLEEAIRAEGEAKKALAEIGRAHV